MDKRRTSNRNNDHNEANALSRENPRSSYYMKDSGQIATAEDDNKSIQEELIHHVRRQKKSAIMRRCCSMTTMFTATIAILVIISSLAPILIMIITERKNVDTRMRQINTHVIELVTQNVNNQFSEIGKTAVCLRQLILKNSNPIIDKFQSSRERIIELIWGIFDEFPVASMLFLSKDNSAIGLVRDEGGVSVILDKWYRNEAMYWGPIDLEERTGWNNTWSAFPSFQPSQRIYWKTVTLARQNTWSGFFLAGKGLSPLMSYASPVFNTSAPSIDGQGDLVGASVAFVNLTGFSTFLNQLNLGKSGVAYTMEPNGLLTASGDSETKLFRWLNSTHHVRTDASNCNNILISSSAKYILANKGEFFAHRSIEFYLTPKGGLQLMGSAYLYSEPGLSLYLVTVLQRNDFLGNTVIVNSLSITISFCLVVFSIAYGIIFTVSVIRQIQKLSAQMEKVSRMNLSGIDTTGSPNMITEIGAMQLSFWGMVASLREFKAFLPPGLVQDDDEEEEAQGVGNKVTPVDSEPIERNSISNRISMSSDGSSHSRSDGKVATHSITKFVLGVQVKDISVLQIQFDDIVDQLQNSSSLSDPTSLITSQGVILSTIDSIVTKHRGNIDDFDLGKLVISWNTVKSCVNPGLKSARAAHQILKSLQNMSRRNHSAPNKLFPSNPTMAISTGKAIVGNIGNKSMRKHTTSGSVFAKVNAMNKLHAAYDTHILIDDKTGEDLKRTFHLRPINIFEMQLDSRGIQTEKFGVLELVKANENQSDEWMYEMTSKNENEMWDLVRNAFYDLFKEDPDYESIITRMDNYLKLNINDQIVKNLRDDVYSASVSREGLYPITSISSFHTSKRANINTI